MQYAERSQIVAKHSSAPYVHFLRRVGLDIDVVAADGATLLDTNGRRYVDCIAGYGNCFVGHNPQSIIDAVVAEIESPAPFNLPFLNEAQARFFEELAKVAPGDLDCCYAVNSGSEAVESALKLTRLATGRPGIICMSGAWHGFTLGCLSVSEPSMTKQFMPLLDNITRVAFGDAEAAEAAIDDSVGAVIVEPIQAENGAVTPPAGYLQDLRRVCSERKVVLIMDEAKTGMGKTGRMFACMDEDVVPDILICGKALGGGVMPIGAIVARRGVWAKFGLSFPMSSSSGAGNAPACAAALATLQYVKRERICEKALRQGARLRAGLESLCAAFPSRALAIDGRGLLLSLQTTSIQAASRLIEASAKRGVLIMAAFCDRTKVLIEPPASITDEEADTVIEVLTDAVGSADE